MGKHFEQVPNLEQALAICVRSPVHITFTYLGGLPQVGFECGAQPESEWPHDGVGFI